MIRYLFALTAGLAALNAFLLGMPGDMVPQEVLLGLGAASAFLGAVGAFLSAPQPPMTH